MSSHDDYIHTYFMITCLALCEDNGFASLLFHETPNFKTILSTINLPHNKCQTCDHERGETNRENYAPQLVGS